MFELIESSSKEWILFFTNRGMMYRKKAYEIPQANRTSKGIHVSSLLNLSEGEEVINIIAVKSFSENHFLVIATKNGLIKRSTISDYDTSLKSSGLTAIKLNENDSVAFVMVTNGSQDIFVVTKNGNCVRYPEALVSVQGRVTQGVRAMILSPEDEIVQIMPIDNSSQPNIMVLTQGGFGKRSSSDEYRALGGRNVKGYSVINKASLQKNGHVIGACCINGTDSVIVSTNNGKVIRINADELRKTGRTTSGVKILSLEDGDQARRIMSVKQEYIEENHDIVGN